MNKDDYGEVINGEATYYLISNQLKETGSIIIGWTDEASSHYDILFTLKPVQAGRIQGGLMGSTDLFVSIMRKGAFGFDAKGTKTSAGYIEEKFEFYKSNTSTSALSMLINGIREELNK